MKYLLFLFFLFSTSKLLAQDYYYDSLFKQAHVVKGESRVEIIAQICHNGKQINQDSFLYFIHLFQQAIKEYPSPKNIANSHVFYANCLLLKTNYVKTFHYVDSVLNMLPNTNQNRHELGMLTLLKATALIRSSKIKEGLGIALEIANSAIECGDKDLGLRAKTTAGTANMEIGNTPEAVKYFKYILQEANTPDLEEIQTIACANLTPCFGQMAMLDSAKKYLMIGKSLSLKHHQIFNYLAFLNFENNFFMMEKNYKAVIKNHEEILAIRNQMNDPYFMVSDLLQFSQFYSSIHSFEKAMQYLKTADSLIEKYNIRQKRKMVYNASYVYHQARGESNLAVNDLKKYIELQDSLYEESNAESLAFLQAKYDKSEKEKLIAKQHLEIKNKNFQILGGIMLLIFSSLIAFLLHKSSEREKQNEYQQKLIDEQIKSAKLMIDAEERERKRIAADLHDGIGQLLSAAKMNLHAFEDESVANRESIVLAKAIDLVNESAKEIRNVSHSIMPNALLKSGLGMAVKDFIEKLNQQKLSINVTTIGLNQTFDGNVEIMTYRIIQECVSNVIKHSKASRLDVSVVFENSHLVISIEDNGIGFDKLQLNKFEGIGLKNIQTRVEFLRGKLEIDSQTNNGTSITIEIPVNEKL
jgi:two-component system, NarL family, sensor kinase